MAIDIEIPGYELIKEIGSGGMARVFAGTQLSLGREVAIKVLRASLTGEDFKRRFLHEGQMLAKLIHPNIVPIHDIGQTDSAYYMAMEYLRGGTLTERIREGLTVAEIIRICTQVAHALNLAHDHKIVHRDLKPSNIMFRDELTPVLTDFGIARKTDADHRLTKTGMVVGTPYYMSPEQITGKPIDGRADIYSLGVMFYELLAGELPFRAEEPLALAMQHVQTEPPPLPQGLAELQPIMDRMLAKKPEDRFATMLEFCRAIKDLVMTEQAFAAKLSGETKIFNSDQFSDPRFGSDALRVPERISRDMDRVGDRGKVAPTRISRESGRRVQPSAAPRRRWVWPAAGVALALLSILGGVFYTDVAKLFSDGAAGLSEADRRMVDNLLDRVNGYIIRNQIESPPGENAVEMLNQALALAPQYGPAQKYASQIAVFYETDARTALAAGDRELALSKTSKGLAISPGYEPLKQIKADIDTQIALEEKRRRIAELLAQAEVHVQAGELIEPAGTNALETYQEVLELDPLNETASEGRKQIQESLVAAVRAAIQANELDSAAARLARAEALFGSTSLVGDARAELDAEQRRLRELAQVTELLAEGRRLFEAGALVEPAGASAVDPYQAVLRIRPDEPDALRGLADIAAEFERRAAAALAGEDYKLAAELAASGLQAAPEHDPLLAIQQRATEALGARDREIQQTLQQAERLAQGGTFLAAGGQDALNAYRRVLELDPENARARRALAQLPDRIYTASQQLERGGDFGGARSLVARARQEYPNDARFDALDSRLAAAMQAEARRQRLASLLADSRRLIEVEPLTGVAIERAAQALKRIIAEYPNDVEVVSQIGELTASIAAAAEDMSAAGEDDQALALIRSGLGQFPDNENLALARRDVTARKTRRQEEEAARIAAMSGKLAIDATPWGEVVEIKDAAGNTRALPSDATTPLVLSLLEGDYRVTVQGGSSSRAVALEVTVERQQLVRRRADFESMDAERYFERSGW